MLTTETDFLIDRMASRTYWQEIAPDLAISDTPLDTAPLPRDDLRDSRLRKRLLAEGALHVASLGLDAPFDGIARAMEALRDRGLPPAFVGVYDAPWMSCGQLRRLIGNLLGTSAALVPDFWAGVVRPGESGFAPHRDRPQGSMEAEGPITLTVWLPVTPSRTENGCIHVIPAQHDANYLEGNLSGFQPQQIRALPAEPGDLLAWTGRTAHWGSTSSPFAESPRLSIAWEFQRADRGPVEGYLMERYPDMPFEKRLGLIGRQMNFYSTWSGTDEAWCKLSSGLERRFPIDPRVSVAAR